MSFDHEAIAALPVLTAADKALIRACLTRRFVYVLATSEDSRDFVAVDPDSGILPLYLKQNNVDFQLDATDTTTAHDGVTCLVTSDAKRYKSDSATYPWSVKARATAQPTSPAPSIGDRYLLNAAATGTDWAGHDDQVAIYTQRGWVFATIPLGRFLYVEGETAFYHIDAAGDWTAGIGSIAIGSNTVPLSALIGTGVKSIVKVENQTTNTPPASPTVPTSYIIGSSPTGAWAGKAGQVARCEAAGTWTYYVPATGDRVFDKSLTIDVRWNGTAWVSAAGVIIGAPPAVFTAGTGDVSAVIAGSNYFYSDTVAPTTSNGRVVDGWPITYAAQSASSRLRFRYQAKITITVGNILSIALFRDSLGTALDWAMLPTASGTYFIAYEFEISAPDASSHTYSIEFPIQDSGGSGLSSASRRSFSVQEIAA